MKRIIAIALLQIVPLLAGAQSASNFSKTWINGLGFPFLMKFGGNTVSTSFADTTGGLGFTRGSSNICDSFGNLQICSDGFRAYDRNLDLIQNGDSLVSPSYYYMYDISTASQSSIILPLKNNKYYLIIAGVSETFYNQASSSWTFDSLVCYTIDMNLNGGKGKVIMPGKTLLSNTKLSIAQMTAVRHGNGEDWWLIKQGYDSNIVYKFILKNDTVLSAGVQKFTERNFGTLAQGGQSVFSKNGGRYASTIRGAGFVFVADFNRCTGEFSNPSYYDAPVVSTHNPSDPSQTEPWTESVAFSPNGKMLYVGSYFNIRQMDLSSSPPAWSIVAGLDTSWAAFQHYSTLYLGPDDKLYIGNWHGSCTEMSVISNPNGKGAACSFCRKCIRFPLFHGQMHGAAMDPPNQPNYALGPATAPNCWTVNVPETEAAMPDFSVYPNPTTGILHIRYSLAAGSKGSVEVTDILGRRVHTVQLDDGRREAEMDLGNKPTGVYQYRYLVDGVQVEVGKVVVTP